MRLSFTAWSTAAVIAASSMLCALSALCLSSCTALCTCSSVASSDRPSNCKVSFFMRLLLLLLILAAGLPPLAFSLSSVMLSCPSVLVSSSRGKASHASPTASVSSWPLFDSCKASSLLPMSTMLTSVSLERKTVARVCPGNKCTGSTLVSTMSSPALHIFRKPPSHLSAICFANGSFSSNTGVPLSASPSKRRFSTRPIGSGLPLLKLLRCIHSSTGFFSYCVMSMPVVITRLP